MTPYRRLLEAVTDISRYIQHGDVEERCAACPRWDELQQAALAMHDAVAAEREACAQVAENGLIGHTIAKAIRARGER